jgi:hypothetical protein
MAEGVGFEPTSPFEEAVFKTAALNHSAIPPHLTIHLYSHGNPSTNPLRGIPFQTGRLKPLGHPSTPYHLSLQPWQPFHKSVSGNPVSDGAP